MSNTDKILENQLIGSNKLPTMNQMTLNGNSFGNTVSFFSCSFQMTKLFINFKLHIKQLDCISFMGMNPVMSMSMNPMMHGMNPMMGMHSMFMNPIVNQIGQMSQMNEMNQKMVQLQKELEIMKRREANRKKKEENEEGESDLDLRSHEDT